MIYAACRAAAAILLLLLLLPAAESQAEEGNAARTKLQALLARKQEAANKLELLQQEISMMANMNPAELAALEKEVGTLVAQMSAAEARKAAMELQVWFRAQTLSLGGTAGGWWALLACQVAEWDS